MNNEEHMVLNSRNERASEVPTVLFVHTLFYSIFGVDKVFEGILMRPANSLSGLVLRNMRN